MGLPSHPLITSSSYHAQSNGRVENAGKTCKSLLLKARADKRDPLLALLKWRNTPTESTNASPTQLLYGRRIRTRLRVAKTLLEPQVITNVSEKIKMKKQKKKYYCDQHSHELPKLRDGDAIRMHLSGYKKWSLGQVNGGVGNLSYLVEVNEKQYRRNRRWLRATAEELEPSEINELPEKTEPSEASSDELPQSVVPSTQVASEPHTASRSTCERRPPLGLSTRLRVLRN